ncbi:MAG: tetratricopeptide repeat protein [Selenomonadaceae bacterium]|nr:tetratricopeptide repeat protein [Selenomonadaceae bacterium]
MKKFVRRALMAVLIVIFVLSAAIVGAAVKIFDGYGECEMGEFTTMPKVKERALERAKLDAQKQAGMYLKAESRSVASELVDDAISAVTNNIIEISDVQYETITQKITERTTAVVVVAKLKASIDPNGIYDWLKRDDKEKVTIIQQNDSLQDAIAKNDKEFEDLKEQYKRATSQADKDRIIKQMEQVDRDFLANQKFEEALKLYYAKDYQGSIKLNTEAIELKPDWSWPYNNRGMAYDYLGQYERAIQDYNKALELNPNFALAYYNRGNTYYDLGQKERAIQDYTKAIKLHPNLAEAYNNRGNAYDNLGQKERAIQDYTKAIELNSNHANAYFNRGNVYYNLGQKERAIQDYTKAIELNPNDYEAYNNCGYAYYILGQKERAIQDYTKAIELNPNYALAYNNRSIAYSNLKQYDKAIADKTKYIQLRPNDAKAYYWRGKYYQALGDNEKAQADFAKAKELGYNG